ncbi:MAG: dockerin type I domain-containing protein, partial [Acutalibacteraceae bacterium]
DWEEYVAGDPVPTAIASEKTGKKFSGDSLPVTLTLRDATSGTYSIDGSEPVSFSDTTEIYVGYGLKGGCSTKLTLTATNGTDITTKEYIYTKTFSVKKSTFSSPSDGHTTEPESNYYGTNPNKSLGKKATITVDGKCDDWTDDMLIAIGQANDDPRVYRPSSIHERAVDDYALYACWDNDNLYFMWEMANLSSILAGNDNIFSAQKPNGAIWNPGMPFFIVLSVDPEKSGNGASKETTKSGVVYHDYVWDSGITFDTNIDTFITLDTANTNGGDAIIPLDDDGYFNYDEQIVVGRLNNNPGTPNQNGFSIAWDYGQYSKTLYGVDGYGDKRTIGDTTDSSSEIIDFYSKGYKADSGFIYEISIPLEHLGIDESYIENNGIGAMLISTFGTSAMDCLPHDPSMLDNADKEYIPETSSSHEKEDLDNITVPLARIGAFLPDTVENKAGLQVDFGADKSSGIPVNTDVTLSADLYGAEGEANYSIYVNDTLVSTNDSYTWRPSEKGVYKVTCKATDDTDEKVVSYDFSVGSSYIAPTNPSTNPSSEVSSILGDVNNDKQLSVKDATAIQKYCAKIFTSSDLNLDVADFNGDKIVNVKDATMIQKKIAKLL